MKGHVNWSYRPYQPLLFETGTPYVCRVVPREHEIRVEWLPEAGVEEYTVSCARRGEPMADVGTVAGCAYTLEGLESGVDWQFQVRCEKGASRVRLARTGPCDGSEPCDGNMSAIINYLHPEDDCYSFSGHYLCSPSIVRHPMGHLVASMDVFAGKTPQNLTLVFRSDDDGRTWRYVCELYPCFWGKLFVHRDKLYMLGCSNEYGDLLIGCSEDGGETFGEPRCLLRGSCHSSWNGVHKNPQPVVTYAHRLWNTCEWGCWANGAHAPMVFSCDVDADLMNPESWSITPPLPYDPSWPGTAEGKSAGNIEGTLVRLRDGNLYNVMRYDMRQCTPNYGRILAYRVNAEDPDAPLTYSHAIEFPANHSKFEIQYDEKSDCYYSIASRIRGPEHSGDRNLLSLMVSRDAERWSVGCDLIDRRDDDPAQVGFQYVDFFFEGDDLLWMCRTSVNGAHNFHDANYEVFHRLGNFRKYAAK